MDPLSLLSGSCRAPRADAGPPPAARRALGAALAGLALLPLLGGCAGDDDEPRPITRTRTATATPRPVVAGMPDAERFGFSRGPARGGAGHAPAEQPPLAWDVPTGWDVLPPTQFRTANLRPGGDPETECYLTILPGPGGGEVANVNRWREQMGLPALSPAQVAALPTRRLLGEEARVVDVEGTFSGMAGMGGAEPARAGYRMLGAILAYPDGMVFVKMTGPAARIAAESPRYEAFLDSIRFRSAGAAGHVHGDDCDHGHDHAGHDHAGHDHAGHDDAGHDHGQGYDGQDHAGHDHAGHDHGQGYDGHGQAGSHGGAAAPERPELAWATPEGWTVGPERPMRAVSFALGASGKTECYVSVLRGPAGGVEANLDRWAEQMGRAALSAEEHAALPRLTVLGRDAVLLAIDGGDYTGILGASKADAGLLGVVVPLTEHTLFVKMTGPRAEVAQEEARFRAFCASLALRDD